MVPFILLGCGPKGKVVGPYIGDLKDRYENITLTNKQIIQTGGSYGGMFIDVSVKRFLATESSYVFSFTSNKIDSSFRVALSSNEHMVASEVTGKEFTITTTAVAGDTIMQLYDSDDILVYRNVIRVRPKQTKETILNAVDSAQNYKTMKEVTDLLEENWTLQTMRFDDHTLSCVLAGRDGYGSNKCQFRINTDECVYEESPDWYKFKVQNSVSENRDTIITYICVATAADVMYAYVGRPELGTDTRIAYLYHSDLSYIYE